MKQLFTNIKQRIALWRLLGGNKVLFRFEGKDMGGFRATFRRYWLDIDSISNNFHLRLMVGTHPFGYLMESARQGIVDNIHGYCVYMYKIAMCLTTEKGFVDEITKAMYKYDKRMEKRAESAPKASEFDDELALREVKANVERGQMTRQQRRKAERQARKNMKEGMADIKAEEAKNADEAEK